MLCTLYFDIQIYKCAQVLCLVATDLDICFMLYTGNCKMYLSFVVARNHFLETHIEYIDSCGSSVCAQKLRIYTTAEQINIVSTLIDINIDPLS